MDLNYDRKLVTKGKWLDLFKIDYLKPNGEPEIHQYVQRSTCDPVKGTPDGVAAS